VELNEKEQLKRAASERQFEIQMFWQRSNYFMVLNTAIAVGFFSILPNPFAPILALLGAFACGVWLSVTAGAKYWQSRWEEAAWKLEERCAPKYKLFSANAEDIHAEVKESLTRWPHQGLHRCMDSLVLRKPSVSFMMSALAVFFIAFWVIAFGMSLWIAICV
jgi:hypothetical protein